MSKEAGAGSREVRLRSLLELLTAGAEDQRPAALIGAAGLLLVDLMSDSHSQRLAVPGATRDGNPSSKGTQSEGDARVDMPKPHEEGRPRDRQIVVYVHYGVCCDPLHGPLVLHHRGARPRRKLPLLAPGRRSARSVRWRWWAVRRLGWAQHGFKRSIRPLAAGERVDPKTRT